ncbi:hypothetical protein ABZ682_22825 [Streptomyces griseoviridis]|uniref:hypothetical protein n=1 Tax=Streptomyces griseoviridis TaxID=45398 RepID=UPI003400DD5B
MSPSADERWTQRILGGLGARPVGHTDPSDDDDGSQVPAQSPAQSPAPPAPRSSPRMPDWWRVGRPDIGATPDPGKLDEADDQEDSEENCDAGEDQELEETEPAAPGGPVVKVPADIRRTSIRQMGEAAAGDHRMRIVLFNATAAGLGWSLGLVGVFAAYMPVAEQAATGTFAFALATAGAVTAWKVAGAEAVRTVFKDTTIYLRCLATVGAAEVGRSLAPIPVAYLNRYGQEWGLGPSAISLLITAGGICGLLWWFIDRHIRHWPWLCRWLCRVPLASALIACIPHTGTPVA